MKRLIDIFLIVLFLPLLLPIVGIVAVVSLIVQGRPVFFVQRRAGRGEHPFDIIKFRTMLPGAGPDASRLTRWGRFLRATSIDELPELVNVLRGEMSLVGPRPLPVEYLPRYTPEQRRRHEVLPGVTGWAQVHGRNALDWEVKFRYDLDYVDHHSFFLDLKILALTILRVARRDGIAHDGEATMAEFTGKVSSSLKLPAVLLGAGLALGGANAADTNVVDLGIVLVEGNALSKYRPEKVTGGTFTDEAPEKLPCVVDTLTEDFVRERNPTDLNDLLRWVPGIETGGTSLLVRQPGLFSVRGMGGTEPAFDGVISVGRGAGLFMDPSMMERVEIVKGPVGSLMGGAGAQQNNNGAGGSVNLYLKGAHLRGSERTFQETTSIGRETWRQRGMIDANEVLVDGKFAVRLPVSFDVYSPNYTANGSQAGARPREQYTLAPSFLFAPREGLSFGLKTMFVSSDSPSYIGVPVWRGKPGGGYDWDESSCRKGDRSIYRGMMVNPYVDWQVTDDWLLKLGGAFMYSHLEQTTREPYTESDTGLQHYFDTGHWLDETAKYQTTNFSKSRSFSRNFNLYARSVYTKEELPLGFRNTFMMQPDFYYRDSSGGFGTPTSRYGVTLQDSVGWGWVTLLAGLRYDYFVENSTTQTSTAKNGTKTTTHYPEAHAFAFSPRGGLTIQPLDWLVFFGNLAETRTPTLGYLSADGSRPTDPWVARQCEGGIRLRPLEKTWLGASYYRIDQKNMPQLDDDSGNYYFGGHNSSDGVELSLSGDLTENWTAMAMYAFNLYENHDATGKARKFERVPRNTVSLSTSYRLHGFDLIEDVVVGLGYRYRSMSYACMRGSYVNENLRFDPSHVFDVNVAVPLSKFGLADGWFLSFGVRNLFGERYFDTSRHYYECFAGEPRTFEIGLRGRF